MAIRFLRRRRRRTIRSLAAVLLTQLPHFLRLLYRLVRDPRVAILDKALLLGVVAYIIMPADLVPDFLGLMGRVDDLYLLGLALDRLVVRAGGDVLRDHWTGTSGALGVLTDAIEDLGSILPRSVRRLLRGRVPV